LRQKITKSWTYTAPDADRSAHIAPGLSLEGVNGVNGRYNYETLRGKRCFVEYAKRKEKWEVGGKGYAGPAD